MDGMPGFNMISGVGLWAFLTSSGYRQVGLSNPGLLVSIDREAVVTNKGPVCRFFFFHNMKGLFVAIKYQSR